MNRSKNIVNLPIYHYSLVLCSEFIVLYKSELENGQNLYNLVTDAEKFVLDTLDILQNITTTLEKLDMAFGFICNRYDTMGNGLLESYNYDLYHMDVFNNKMVTLNDLIYKLVSLVYGLSDWVREINKANHKNGAKFNFGFINAHREEVRKKLNNDCLFSLLQSDLDVHLKQIIRDRNKSVHDGEMNDYSYDGKAIGFLLGVEKGIMKFDDLKSLQYIARAMTDGHQKLISDMKIYIENAYELTRVALCSLSDKFVKVISDTLPKKDLEFLNGIESK